MTYAQVQQRVNFTVYAPAETFGLARAGFDLSLACDDPQGLLFAQYGGTGSATKEIYFDQFGLPCGDLELGYSEVASFRVRGVRATIFARCPGEQEECTGLPQSSAVKSAATVVVLPGVAGRHRTYVVLGTRGLTVKQIKEFVTLLRPVL
jgi:hypothetical protein